MRFAFLACFNVVLPAIAPIALLNSLFFMRSIAHRNLCFLRRPEPNGSEGIGAWQSLLEVVEILAVVINVGFAVFTMEPLKSFSPRVKFAIFVASQYSILLMKCL